MSEERKVNLVIAAENQTKGPLDEIKQGVASAAANIEQSGKKAAKGIEGLGDSIKKVGRESGDGLKKVGDGFKGAGEKSKQGEEQVSQAARSMIQSIQRTTAAAEAGEKGTAKYFEVLAKQRGVGGDVLEPYLAQLRAAEAAQNKLGVSAGQTQAALRQLPAQFSDIVVSLQGGQAPLTVFLQQGSQIKDSFGGAGQAVKAMGGYVLSMVNPLTVGAAAVAALGVAYFHGSQEADNFRMAIVTTGNASGVTTSQLQEYSRQIGAVVGTQAQAADGLAAFTAAGVRGGEELRRYTQTAIEWEKATGQAVDKTAEKFAGLQKDPLAGVLKLNEGTNFLTASVYEQIKALVEQGDKAGAARLAMDTLDTTMRERGNSIKESLGYIQRGWDGITSAAAKAWGAMLNVGRATTINDQLAGVRKELSQLLAQSETGFGETAGGAATGRSNAAYVRGIKQRIDALRIEESALNFKIEAEQKAAAASAESARQMEALAAFDKDYAKALDKEATLQQKLAKARKEGLDAGKSEADIKRVLAYVTEEHNKANKGSAAAARAAKKELADQAKVYAEIAGVSSTYYADLARGEKQLAKGEITRDQYIKYVEDLIRKQPFAIALAKEEAEVSKARVKAWEDEVKAAQKQLEARVKSAEAVEDTLLKAREEERAHQLAAAAGITHAEAVARLALARAEDNYQKALSKGADGDTLLALQRETDARRSLIEVMQQKGVREANEKAAKEIEKQWDKTSQLIGQTLSDYIMGGGKDAAQYLKRLFATLVLQPIVQYGVNSAMGALGMGQQGSAVQSVLGGNNVGSTVLNNAGAIGAGYQAMFGASAGASSASLFGANAVGLMGGDALGTLAAANGMWAGVATGAQATAQAAVAANLALEAGTAVALEAGTLGTAIGTGATGVAAGASSMMAGVMAAAPYLAAVVALYAIIAGMDDSGTPHSGAGAVYSKATGVQSGAEIYNQSTFGMGHRDEYSEDMQAGISGIAKGLGQTLDTFAVSFGKAAGYSVATAFADDSSKDGSWGSLKIADELGKVLVNWEDSRASKWAPREFADGEDGYKEYLKAVAVDVKAAFLTMDLPAWANQALKAATDIDTLTAALQEIATIKSVLDGLGKTMGMFADLSGELQTRLLAASGGVEALASNAGAFYESFYTEGERALKQRELQMAALAGMGLYIDPAEGDAAKAAFKKTVQDAMESGQVELAAQLLAMSGAFASTADYAKQFADETAKVAQSLRDSLISLEGRFAGGGFSRQYQAEGAASQMQKLLSSAGVQMEVGTLASVMMSATSSEVEHYFREIWKVLPTDAAKAELVGLANTMMDLAAAAEEAAQAGRETAADNAWANVQAAIDREKEYWSEIAGASQTAIAALSGSLSLLTSNARELYGTVDSAQQMLAAQGMVYIENALSSVRGGASAADFTGLQDAIGASRSGISAGVYVSDFERQRDTLVLAGQLAELGDLTDNQLSVEQRALDAAQEQIKQLDMTLDYWQQQVDGTAQLIDASLSIEGAISALGAALAAREAGKAAAGGGGGGGAGGSSGGIVSDSMLKTVGDAWAAGDWITAQNYIRGQGISNDQLQGAFDLNYADLRYLFEQGITTQNPGTYSFKSTTPEGVYSEAKAQGLSLSEVNALLGAGAGEAEDWAKKMGLPIFHEGTNYVPRTGFAVLQEGEQVVPRAFNPYAGGMGQQGSNAELVAENRALRAKVDRLEGQLVRVANATERLADQFDNATAGGNAMAVEVMT